jgi:hypothetical protein
MHLLDKLLAEKPVVPVLQLSHLELLDLPTGRWKYQLRPVQKQLIENSIWILSGL